MLLRKQKLIWRPRGGNFNERWEYRSMTDRWHLLTTLLLYQIELLHSRLCLSCGTNVTANRFLLLCSVLQGLLFHCRLLFPSLTSSYINFLLYGNLKHFRFDWILIISVNKFGEPQSGILFISNSKLNRGCCEMMSSMLFRIGFLKTNCDVISEQLDIQTTRNS